MLVRLRPADEAPVEGIAEAGGATAGVAGVHVLAAGAQVALEVPLIDGCPPEWASAWGEDMGSSWSFGPAWSNSGCDGCRLGSS